MKLKTLCAAGALLLWSGEAAAETVDVIVEDCGISHYLRPYSTISNKSFRVNYEFDWYEIESEIGKVIDLKVSGEIINQRRFFNLLKKACNLKSLSIRDAKLAKIPEEIFALKNLKKLDLSENKIRNVSEYIKNLTKLKNLNLSDNAIEELPETIGNLKNLKTLRLYRNKLENLPEGLWNLSNLEFLGLGQNKIKTISAKIENLKNLKTLYLHCNAINTLPAEMANLNKLEDLHIHWNDGLKLKYDKKKDAILAENPSVLYSIFANPRLEFLYISAEGDWYGGIADLNENRLSEIKNRSIKEALLEIQGKLKSLSNEEQKIEESKHNIQDKLEFLGKEKRRLKNESASKKLKKNVRQQMKLATGELEEIQKQKESVRNKTEKLKEYMEKFQSLLGTIKH